MARLTKGMREEFVRRVMDDVPEIDYDEMITKIVQDEAAAQLPPLIRTVLQTKELRPFLKTEHTSFHDDDGTHDWFDVVANPDYEPSADVVEKVTKLHRLDGQQTEKLQSIRTQLQAIADTCSTTDALKQRLPEMEKYIPVPVAEAKNWPVATTNLVTALMQMGWPDEKKAA